MLTRKVTNPVISTALDADRLLADHHAPRTAEIVTILDRLGVFGRCSHRVLALVVVRLLTRRSHTVGESRRGAQRMRLTHDGLVRHHGE